MASTQIQTAGYAGSLPCAPNAKAIVRAGSRLWAAIASEGTGSDTGLNLYYSDNDGGTWVKHSDVDATNARFAVALDAALVGGTWELHMAYAALLSDNAYALKHASVLSNVNTGTPGAVNIDTVDAGGTNLGVCHPALVITPTSSNPRVWIVASKWTAASVVENRLWRAAASTASPTWTSYNNINSQTASVPQNKGGTLVYWTVSAADRLTVIVKKTGSPASYDSFTFDPSVTTPTLGTATNMGVLEGGTDWLGDEAYGPLCCVAAKADYIVFARQQRISGLVDFYKSVNGTSWSQPSGWTNLTMGRMSIGLSGSDFHVIHGATFGVPNTTTSVLKYRKITTSSDTMGGVTDFSDSQGNPVSVPRDTGTNNLYGLYRGSTTSPYTVRSDFVSIGGGGDVTPPGSAAVTIAANVAGARLDITATMPADSDVAAYEIRRTTGVNPPASDRSDGTIVVAETATSANAVVVFNNTSLTNGTRYRYRVFVKDTSGNWNTGTVVTGVAAVPPAFQQRYKANGTTTVPDGVTVAGNNPVFQWQPVAGAYESGKVAHFRARSANDEALTQSVNDYVSTSGGSTFRYEDPADSGTYVNVPAGGLGTSLHGRRIRLYSVESGPSRWVSLRVEQ